MDKRPIYSGYEEKFLTGKELKQLFADSYECYGKNHQQISSHKMNFGKYKKLRNDTTYRVFLNDLICGIYDSDTDAKLYFFGYTNERPNWAKE